MLTAPACSPLQACGKLTGQSTLTPCCPSVGGAESHTCNPPVALSFPGPCGKMCMTKTRCALQLTHTSRASRTTRHMAPRGVGDSAAIAPTPTVAEADRR